MKVLCHTVSMNPLNEISMKRLSQCHDILQNLFSQVSRLTSIAILCGHRDKDEQETAFNLGNSKLHFPQSKHNQYPSLAVDVAPYPIDWQDIKRFQTLAELVRQVASDQYVEDNIEWGGDWKMRDYPHWEIKS